MNYSQAVQTRDLTMDELAADLSKIRADIHRLKEAEWLLSQQIIEEMDLTQATLAETTEGTVEIQRRYRYDQAAFRPLMEMMSEEDLIEHGAYKPSHTEVVPAKWVTAKVKALTNRGREYSDIVERARYIERTTIKLTPNKEDKRDNG
jgi:hypothetical protein